MYKIVFTKHAEDKFAILAKYKFKISKRQVIETINNSDLIDTNSRYPLIIAQSKIDQNHVLRVIYKVENGIKVVITFYPGRSKQYEK